MPKINISDYDCIIKPIKKYYNVETNNDIDIDYNLHSYKKFNNYLNITNQYSEEEWISALQNDEVDLKDIPKKSRTDKICLVAIKKDIKALHHVPNNKFSDELCEIAVKIDGMALNDIPEEKRTVQICMCAIQQNGCSLQYVPKNMRTASICLNAVHNNGLALSFVPKDELTAEIYMLAVLDLPQLLPSVPEDICTNEFYMSLVKKDGVILKYIIAEKRTPDICLASVEQNGMALEYVPEHRLTFDLCLTAVLATRFAIDFVPKQMRPKIYREVVKRNGQALSWIPEEAQTLELCMRAMSQSPGAIRYISGKNCTMEMCLMAVCKNGMLLEFVPAHLRTREVCLAAVQQETDALLYVPDIMKTADLFESILQKDGLFIKHIPATIIRENMYLKAVQQNVKAMAFVPSNKLNLQICVSAVQQDARYLSYVPDHLKLEVIDTITVKNIIANNFEAINYFPKNKDLDKEVEEILSSIKYIVIGKNEPEIKDAQLVYINKKQDVVSLIPDFYLRSELSKLLEKLKKLNANNLRIVFIGHANETVSHIAGFDYKEITEFCENNPNIKEIQLIGCNVVKAKQTQEEIEMLEKFAEKMKIKDGLQYGLVTSFNEHINDSLFEKKCLNFCKNNNLNGVYILNKLNAENYQLFAIKYDSNLNTVAKKVRPVLKIQDIQTILENGKHIAFPAASNILLPIRQKDHPLTSNELRSLRDLTSTHYRFEKMHPHYKKDKKTYPFLAKITANMEDLKPSFIKKLADEIKDNNNITWDVSIQGPTKAVYVDASLRDFKISKTHLYTNWYNQPVFFHPEKKMIAYNKLQKERMDEIKDMKATTTSDTESMASQLKVIVHKSR